MSSENSKRQTSSSARHVIIIFGAGGATGKEAVKQAAEKGYEVRAVEHSWPAYSVDSENVHHHTADVMKDNLSELVKESGLVLSSIGVGLSAKTILDPPPLYTQGTLNVVNAMNRMDVRRLVVISATFVDRAH